MYTTWSLRRPLFFLIDSKSLVCMNRVCMLSFQWISFHFCLNWRNGRWIHLLIFLKFLLIRLIRAILLNQLDRIHRLIGFYLIIFFQFTIAVIVLLIRTYWHLSGCFCILITWHSFRCLNFLLLLNRGLFFHERIKFI